MAIVGRAVARMVWSSTAGNIAATIAANGTVTGPLESRYSVANITVTIVVHGEYAEERR